MVGRERQGKRRPAPGWPLRPDALFEAQNEIDRRKDDLISDVEARLRQEVETGPLFTGRSSDQAPSIGRFDSLHLPGAGYGRRDEDAPAALKPKLELTWIGKENRPRLEPRILLEDSTRSYHAAHRVTDHDLFDSLQVATSASSQA